MAAIRTARLALFICALCASAAAAAANVGFREINDGNGAFGLWYPSDAPTAPLQLGRLMCATRQTRRRPPEVFRWWSCRTATAGATTTTT